MTKLYLRFSGNCTCRGCTRIKAGQGMLSCSFTDQVWITLHGRVSRAMTFDSIENARFLISVSGLWRSI